MASGASAQLSVNASRFVPFGSENIKTAFFFYARPEFNICSATGHVCRNCYRARLSGVRHNFRFALVLLGVQNVVLYALAFKHPAQGFRNFDACRSHKNRTALLLQFFDFFNNRRIFFALCSVNCVVFVNARNRFVSGNNNDFEFVDFPELAFFGFGGSGHTGKFFVQSEIILKRNRRKRLRVALDLYVLFRFNRLVKSVRISSSGQYASGELIYNRDFSFFRNYVLDVFFEQSVSA